MVVSYNNLNYDNWYGFFPYKPTFGAAILFFVLFLIVFFLNLTDIILFTSRYGSKFTYQTNKPDEKEPKKELRKTRKYVIDTIIPLLFSVLGEAVSYILRGISIKNSDSLAVYVVSQALVLVSPSAMAGSIYMIFGRLKNFLDANDYALVRSRFFTTIMVTIDVICALMQASGSYLMTTVDNSTTGFDLAIASFAVQIFLFLLFLVIAIRFSILLNKMPTRRSSFIDQGSLTTNAPNWRRLIWILVLSMTFIIFRCILRLAEFIDGLNGKMSTSEVAFYLIDSVPIFIASIILLVGRAQTYLWDLASYKSWDVNHDSNNGHTYELDESNFNYEPEAENDGSHSVNFERKVL